MLIILIITAVQTSNLAEKCTMDSFASEVFITILYRSFTEGYLIATVKTAYWQFCVSFNHPRNKTLDIHSLFKSSCQTVTFSW